MPISDLIRVRPVAQVVAIGRLEQIKAQLSKGDPLSSETEGKLRGLLERYFISERDNRLAIEELLRSLAGGRGGAFLIFGPYGAGKSHLLALISLLADFRECWDYFLRGHGEYAKFAPKAEPRRLVVQMSLDDYAGPAHSLEGIVFDAIERELAGPRHRAWVPLSETSYFLELFEKKALAGRREEWAGFLGKRQAGRWEALKSANRTEAARLAREFLEEAGLPLDYRRSRAEAAGELFGHLKRQGYTGAVVLIDELSTFLASKEKRGLNQDAAFLQFLAQQTATAPLWVVAAAQRSLEDVGDIDAHTLRQIRDRFRGRFVLSMAEIRRVIAEKLLEQKEPPRFALEIAGIYEGYEEAAGRLAFSLEELRDCYPVNPLALECLEALAGNYLSSTRSLIGMVQRGLLGEGGILLEDTRRLLTLDRVFDLEKRDLLGLPEAGRFRGAWEFLSRNLGEIAGEEAAQAAIVAKHLVLLAMAGMRWSVKRLADGLVGCEERELWGNRQKVAQILRLLWRKGAYVEVARGAEREADEYYLEAETDISEAIRARLNEARGAAAQETRVMSWALESLRGEELPLGEIAEGSSREVEWQATRRRVNLTLKRPSLLAEGELAQAAAQLENPASAAHGWLFVAPPGIAPETERAAWGRRHREITGRFGASIGAWLPRALTEDERDLIVEHAALRIVLADATLASTNKGREMRARLNERRRRVEEECRGALRRLYLGGEIIFFEGRKEHKRTAPAQTESWEELLGEIFAPALAACFPRFTAVAPRRRLAGRAQVKRIIEHFIQPGRTAGATGGGLEEQLADWLEPLGILQREGENVALEVKDGPLVRAVLGCFPAPAKEPRPETMISYDNLAGRLQKGEWGLTAEMIEVLAAALIRCGYLRGLDGFLQPLSLAQMAPPLSENLSYLTKGMGVSGKKREWLIELGERVLHQRIEAVDLPRQEALWEGLCGWLERARGDLVEMERALDGFMGALGQKEINWSKSKRAIAQIASLLQNNFAQYASEPGIEIFMQEAHRCAGGRQETVGLFENFARLRTFLREQAPALRAAWAQLRDERFVLPEKEALGRRGKSLQESLCRGEEMLAEGARLAAAWGNLHHAYKVRYTAWHTHQHDPRRYRPLMALQTEDNYRLAERLAQANLDEEGAFARMSAGLGRAIASHCGGALLPAALENSPVCPDCGLQLAQEHKLPDAAQWRAALAAEVKKMLGRLMQEARRQVLLERLEAEPQGGWKDGLAALLQKGEAVSPAEVLEMLTAEAAAWVARQERMKLTTRRKIGDLAGQLQARPWTREQALGIFLRWLEANGRLGEEDLVVIE